MSSICLTALARWILCVLSWPSSTCLTSVTDLPAATAATVQAVTSLLVVLVSSATSCRRMALTAIGGLLTENPVMAGCCLLLTWLSPRLASSRLPDRVLAILLICSRLMLSWPTGGCRSCAYIP